ncbi:hypothetical protein NKT77_10650 [Moraxella sp. FZLJ2107]|uniref:hypothetical protein n=1 Tax=unclassified Moraxella TaxID=2685852 RepID=UPI00209C63C0|nr:MULTISPECIES: hypothetical protein [unclassified Moraxella]USZ14260.1 hypothetical protein NGM44_07685 [Moraxella sp. FZFQ2102]UTO04931.1 hypothetical protein NKT77_10650 [Moraxella sp. FZLJ2107]UTO21665.1 hypothetical protein NKU06_07465 [Moraxella sp. FZLJ2109]
MATSKTKPRYNFLEGITDVLTAYMLAGVLLIVIGGGGLWLLFGTAIILIILLTLMVNFPKGKFKIYAFGLAVYIALLIHTAIKTADQPINELFVLMIVLGMTQAVLTVRYYQNKLKK